MSDNDSKEGEDSWKDTDFLTFENDDDDDDDDAAANQKTASAATGTAVDAADSQSKKRPRYNSNTHTNSNDRNRSTHNSIPSSLTSVTELPPWMDHPHTHTFHQQVPKLVLLHDEIVNFANLMAPQPHELETRQQLVDKVTKLVNDTFDECELKVFGSQATGLLLPTSDIDFVIILPDDKTVADANANGTADLPPDTVTVTVTDTNVKKGKDTKKKNTKKKDDNKLSEKQQEQKDMAEYNVQEVPQSPLAKLGQALRTHPDWKDQLSYLEVVENTRVPIVKFTHAPTNLSVDICFNQAAGTMAAELMTRFLNAMPPLKPLTFVLKYFMAARGLNEPYSGGCGSFMLQMMIVSFLQHRERHAYHRNRNNHGHGNGHENGTANTMNLGSLLLEFFELYGMDFNYLTTGISVRSDGFYFPKGAKGRKEHFHTASRPFSLALENPFDLTADVGKASFRIQLVGKSFEIAMRVLLAHTAEPYVQTESILAGIVPPTDEMYKRATMLKVLNIEERLKKNQAVATAATVTGNGNGNATNGNKRKRQASASTSNMDTSSDPPSSGSDESGAM